jgi:tetratricopeptide (TPR) repeat protein
MRRLNSKLLLILVVAIAVGGLIISGLHAYQVGRQSTAFLREAERAEQAHNSQEAAGFFRTYLQMSPDDTRAMLRLANLLYEDRQFGEAHAWFGEIILRDPANEEARRRLVDTSIRAERYQDAIYQLGFLLKAHPDDAELWSEVGAAQAGLGQLQPAVDAYATAIKKDPGSIKAYEQSALILAERLRDGQAAVVVLANMVAEKQNHAKSEAYITRARFLQAHADDPSIRQVFVARQSSASRKGATGSLPRPADSQHGEDTLQNAVAADVKEALRLAPSSCPALLLGAQAALAAGAVKEARDYADRATRQEPTNAECYLVLASIELHERRVKEACECLSRGLQATDGAPALLWTLANLRLETNDIQQAQTLIDRLRPIEMARPIVRYLTARIRIIESKWAEATHELESVEGELKRWPQLYKDAQLRLAQCYRRLGREDWTVGAYRAALEVDPEFTPARVGLADTLRTQGRVDEAIVELRRLRQRPDAPAHTDAELLRLTILKTLGQPPAERNWTGIDAQLREVLKQPFSVDVALLEAEVELGKDQSDAATRTLRAAIDKAPKDVRLWTALTSLASRLERWDDTERFLSEMQRQLGDSVAVRLARAGYLVRRHGVARSDQLRSLAEAPGFSASDQLDLLFPIGRLAFSVADYDVAERLWRKVADAEPANLQIRLLLIDLASQREKLDDLAKLLTEVEALEQNGPYSHYGHALQSAELAKRLKDEAALKADKSLAAQSDALFDQAIAQLDEAHSRFPSWPKIPLLAAQIADARGQGDAALERYRAAFDLGERSPVVVNRLLGLLVDRQENEKIETVVRQLIDEKVPFSAELTSVVSQALVQMGDRQGALALARKSAAAGKDYRSAILLGELLRVNGRANEAEAAFQKAIQISPREVSPWLALITFYSSSGKKETAEKTLKQSLSAIDPQRTWEIEGYAYQLAGNVQEAEKTYDAALKATPDRFPIRRLAVETKLRARRASQARSLLKEFLASPDGAKQPANVAWARRTLALSLAAAGTYPNYVQALELIEKNLQSPTASDADRRAKAMIQASFPTPESRNRALETLNGLAERPNVLSLDDRIVMARLLRARGEWVKSSQVFRDVVARSKDPRHLTAYIDALLGERELAAADDWLRRLESLAPRDFLTTDLRARLLAAQGRYDEAFERIVGALNQEMSDPSAEAARRRGTSRRLEECGDQLTRLKRLAEAERFFARAESLIRNTGGRGENASADHLQFLIRRDRGAAALAEFDRLCAQGSPAERDQACMALTTWPLADRDLLTRLAQSLGEVASHRPTYSVWVALAAIQDRLEQYDEEEASYRRALALDDRTRIDALNNLAYLLALRNKDLPEAQSLVGKAIALSGPRTSLLDSRAVVELAAGQSDAALADLQAAVSDGASPVHLFHLARARILHGQLDDARASFKRALTSGLSEAGLNRLEASTFEELKVQLATPRG